MIATLRLVAGLIVLACTVNTVEADATDRSAQNIAEIVVTAPFNMDKVIRLSAPFTLGLEMHIEVVEGGTLAVYESTVKLDDERGSLDEMEFSANEAAVDVKHETSLLDKQLAKLDAEVSEDKIVIRMLGSVLFAFDQHDLRPDAVINLLGLLQVVQGFSDSPLHIQGHTDSIGSDEYNQKLSEKRARSVADWLGAHGVTASRVTVSGFGEHLPVATNDTDEGRCQNRRVEIIIKK